MTLPSSWRVMRMSGLSPLSHFLIVFGQHSDDRNGADVSGGSTLILSIATPNFFNRLNVTTRQVAGAWG